MIGQIGAVDPRKFDGTDVSIAYGSGPGSSVIEILASAVESANAAAEILDDTVSVEIPLSILGGRGDAGTWTAAISAAGLATVTRTAGAGTQGFWVALDEAIAVAAARGLRITGAVVVYSVATADATDVRIELYRHTRPADNTTPAAPTLLGGDQNAHYDAAHNTTAERGDDTANPENHTATMTLPTPAEIATGQSFRAKFVVVDPGTSVVVLKAITILAEEFAAA